jgi:hypothetical protein
MLEELVKDFDLPVGNGPGKTLEEDFNQFLAYIGESNRHISMYGMTRCGNRYNGPFNGDTERGRVKSGKRKRRLDG